MDAFYSINNFTISKRSKREIIVDEKLVKGALFAAFVKDLKAYSRVLVKAKHEGTGQYFEIVALFNQGVVKIC